MPFFEFLYRNGIWISMLLLPFGILLLVSFIKNVIRLRAENEIVSVPLLEQQEIEFPESGRVVLCIEGPLFTRRFAGVDFLLSTGDGTPVKGRTTWFHARSSGFTRVRMEVRIFELPMPGRYTLRLVGSGEPRPKDHEHRIVFMRPHLAQMVIAILGIIVSSWICIGSLVLFLLRVLSQEAAQ